MFFLIESFLSNRRLWVVWDGESSSKNAINSAVLYNPVLVYLFFSGYSIFQVIFAGAGKAFGEEG